MKKVFIFGIGDLAKTLFNYIKMDNRYEVIGFSVDDEYYCNDYMYDLPVVKYSELVKKDKSYFYIITAVGYKNMRNKRDCYIRLKADGFRFINYIHESVLIQPDLIIGENNIILSGSIIEFGVEIGSNNIIWSGVILSHDSFVGNHNFIASGCLIGGYSKVKENNFLGFRAIIIDGVIINREVLIGSNSLVLKSPQNYTKNIGNPTKCISNHKKMGICV